MNQTPSPRPLPQREKPRQPLAKPNFEALYEDPAREAQTDQLRATLPAAQTVPALVELLGIETWDYLLVGDGSGTLWTRAGGWAAALVRHNPAHLQWFFGSSSNATNIVCEMQAYVNPLLWLLGQEKPSQKQEIHLITDCEHLVQQWPRPGQWKANKQLWQLLGSLPRVGLNLHFHWIPRDTFPLNQLADELAGLARRTAVALEAEIPHLELKHGLTAPRGENAVPGAD